MADSTMVDISKMKVVDLRKELKTRGLPYSGDKAELTARLQAALAQDTNDDHADINLDSDEIDSDGVLDEDDTKSQNDILDDTINEELALADQPPAELEPTPTPDEVIKPQRTLKRKITMSESSKDAKTEETQTSKKIVLHRTSVTAPITAPKVEEQTETKPASTDNNETDAKVKISSNLDAKTRLEMRAKRFGLPVKMNDDQRKEVRKQRFGQAAATTGALGKISSLPIGENIDKLKQRAQRFGQSVSRFMTDIENTEKIEKRKAKFGTVN